MARLKVADPKYVRLNDLVEQTITKHANICRFIVESLDAVPALAADTGQAPGRAAGDQVKLEDRFKPLLHWTSIPKSFKHGRANLRSSRTNTADDEEKVLYFYSCISDRPL